MIKWFSRESERLQNIWDIKMKTFIISVEYVDDNYEEVVGFTNSEVSAENYCNIQNDIAKDECLNTHHDYVLVIDINKHGDY